jgi:hypothetical protein
VFNLRSEKFVGSNNLSRLVVIQSASIMQNASVYPTCTGTHIIHTQSAAIQLNLFATLGRPRYGPGPNSSHYFLSFQITLFSRSHYHLSLIPIIKLQQKKTLIIQGVR